MSNTSSDDDSDFVERFFIYTTEDTEPTSAAADAEEPEKHIMENKGLSADRRVIVENSKSIEMPYHKKRIPQNSATSPFEHLHMPFNIKRADHESAADDSSEEMSSPEKRAKHSSGHFYQNNYLETKILNRKSLSRSFSDFSNTSFSLRSDDECKMQPVSFYCKISIILLHEL